jgi:hypothetical protein
MATIGFDRQWVFKMQAVNPVIDHLSRVKASKAAQLRRVTSRSPYNLSFSRGSPPAWNLSEVATMVKLDL